MTQAISRRPLTEEARVRSQVSPSGICGGRLDTGAGFSSSSVNVSIHRSSPYLGLYVFGGEQ
jgi:hypothetical protein